MHDSMRHAAQQETIEPLPPMGADHDEVVAISHIAHGGDRITHTDIGGDIELWAGQRLSCVLHDLLSLPVVVLQTSF